MSYCIIQTKEEINAVISECFNHVRRTCMCCNYCFHCKILINLKKEYVKVIETNIKYWSIEWRMNSIDKELIPFLKYYILDG